MTPKIDDDLTARRESMTDILASWELEGARPGERGMAITRRYVEGQLDLDEFIAQMVAVDDRES